MWLPGWSGQVRFTVRITSQKSPVTDFFITPSIEYPPVILLPFVTCLTRIGIVSIKYCVL